MADASGDDRLVSRTAGLLEAEVDGELIGLHIDNGTCYGFNATATRIWALIEQPMSIAEISAHLTSEYDVPADVCAAEVRALVADLEADGLVTLSPAR